MDLREFKPASEQVDAAAQLLRYQPFVLDDDRHTGVAYTWVHNVDPTTATVNALLYDRRIVSEDVWNTAYDLNRRLASTYDAMVARIAAVCPKNGSYLDFACNSGYFPVRASLAGIRMAVGVDLGDYSPSFKILNEITGGCARFSPGGYDSATHALSVGDMQGLDTFDVVSCSAFLCHIPDPLHFLAALARIASRAILLWSGFVDSEELLIRYNPPNKFSAAPFPNGFDDGTSISTGLLALAMSQLGFTRHEEIDPGPDGLPDNWHLQKMPQYQKFRAFLFSR